MNESLEVAAAAAAAVKGCRLVMQKFKKQDFRRPKQRMNRIMAPHHIQKTEKRGKDLGGIRQHGWYADAGFAVLVVAGGGRFCWPLDPYYKQWRRSH